MHVRTLFFASYRDLAGCGERAVQLPPGSSVADLLAHLRDAAPGLRQLPATPAVAVNMTYAAPDRVLADGDEVALIPPVSGG